MLAYAGLRDSRRVGEREAGVRARQTLAYDQPRNLAGASPTATLGAFGPACTTELPRSKDADAAEGHLQ